MRVERDVVFSASTDIGIVDRIDDIGLDGREGSREIIRIGDVDSESKIYFEFLIRCCFKCTSVLDGLNSSELDVGRANPHDEGQDNANKEYERNKECTAAKSTDASSARALCPEVTMMILSPSLNITRRVPRRPRQRS